MSAEAVTAPPDARTRIVAAAIRCIIRDGIGDASMAAIADEAEVSKALLHYHFTDRAHLLAAVVVTLGRRIGAREEGIVSGSHARPPVDALWHWVHEELERGELYALLMVAAVKDEPVVRAVAQVTRARRAAAARTIAALFERLGLTPRVPADAIADTSLVFVEGLAMQRGAARDARLCFDVFWLAMLGLGE